MDDLTDVFPSNCCPCSCKGWDGFGIHDFTHTFPSNCCRCGCKACDGFGTHGLTHTFPSNCCRCGCKACDGFGTHDLTLLFFNRLLPLCRGKGWDGFGIHDITHLMFPSNSCRCHGRCRFIIAMVSRNDRWLNPYDVGCMYPSNRLLQFLVLPPLRRSTTGRRRSHRWPSPWRCDPPSPHSTALKPRPASQPQWPAVRSSPQPPPYSARQPVSSATKTSTSPSTHPTTPSTPSTTSSSTSSSNHPCRSAPPWNSMRISTTPSRRDHFFPNRWPTLSHRSQALTYPSWCKPSTSKPVAGWHTSWRLPWGCVRSLPYPENEELAQPRWRRWPNSSPPKSAVMLSFWQLPEPRRLSHRWWNPWSPWGF